MLLPLGELYALLTAANRLESRERLQRIADMQIAGGHLKKGNARRYLRVLEREARGRREPATPASTSELSALGIKVVRRG